MPVLSLLVAAIVGQNVVVADAALLETPVAGLERTRAEARVVPVLNQSFSMARQIVVRERSSETNATQLTLPNTGVVKQGDTMLVTFWLRGRRPDGRPARVEFLFEKSTDPWTKSVTQPAVARANPEVWRRFQIPFRAAQSYAPGEAMASLRLAFGPQTVELGGFSLVNYGTSRTLESLQAAALDQNTVDGATVTINAKDRRQTMMGLGGNFCQPRYGATEPLDVVGRYTLANLKVVHARIGLPLEKWTPEPGVYRDDAQARASMLQLQEMTRRKIPTVVSVWEGPGWMIGGRPEQMGRTLPRDQYDACIDAIVRYLVIARDKYQAKADYFSFNEADYGVNFRFTSSQIADFIRRAGPKFAAAGLRTKFLVGDTANGTNLYDYARPLLEDRSLAPYLGPIAFHCWDALSASDEAYARIAELGKKHRKAVWCLEAGHDAQLWQAKDPWGTWDNALRTAMAYERTIRLSRASLVDYWTYQDNYPLIDPKGPRPYPVFHVMRQMETVFAPGATVVATSPDREELQAIAMNRNDKLAILLVNSAGGGRVTLKGLPAGAPFAILTSDARGQNVSNRSPVRVLRGGTLAINVPTRSVMTLLSR